MIYPINLVSWQFCIILILNYFLLYEFQIKLIFLLWCYAFCGASFNLLNHKQKSTFINGHINVVNFLFSLLFSETILLLMCPKSNQSYCFVILYFFPLTSFFAIFKSNWSCCSAVINNAVLKAFFSVIFSINWIFLLCCLAFLVI